MELVPYPMSKQQNAVFEANRKPQAPSTLKKELLLVGVFNDAFYRSLNKLGYYSNTALNLQEASDLLNDKLAAKATKNSVRAILCTYKILESNNFGFLHQLQTNQKMSGLPIIMISQGEEIPDIASFIQRGIDDHYKIPFIMEEMLSTIEFLRVFKQLKKQIEHNFSTTKTQPIQTASFHIPWYKRLFDIVFASTVIVLASPVFILLPILIRLESKGVPWYSAKRAGSGYKVFKFYKFRSMYHDADKRLEELKAKNQYGDDSAFFKVENDPRITKLGGFLRKTSLDELPQLFNVLKGDMSIVGNRPLPLYEAEQLTRDQWTHRFLAPAGITGLWQVSKRGASEMSAEERIQLDIDYAEKNTMWGDIKIIFKTLPAMLQKAKV